jgi:hypothetical protein
MASRVYDRTLDCGCQLSSDSGGCVIPCVHAATDTNVNICKDAWDKWKKTKDYEIFAKECRDKNE